MNKLNTLFNTKVTNSTTLKSEPNILEQTHTSRSIESKIKLLSIIVTKIIIDRLHWGFQTSRLIPLRWLRIQ
jgi:hypothetical protein